MTPSVIVTRPAPMGAQFAGQLRARFGARVSVIVSPLLQIEHLPVVDDFTGLEGAVFTSAQSVGAVQLPVGMQAWCVGAKTAARAQAAGFHVASVADDARALVRQITQAAPRGRLAHFRGRHVHENVAGQLRAARINCTEVIAYEQHALGLTENAKTSLNGTAPVVLPLFSARTATILQEQGPFHAPLHIVVMSKQIEQVVNGLNAQSVRIAARPDGDAMTQATVSGLDSLLKCNTDG
ncbi:uroporphyrinogen-III synthase [Yoonia tamlensis]|uniref:Uroporphyrinogen-III synthase n=1 Tax=Yoonia tamlensis TaxID=390270 RepID=A0A1I6HKW8_9RHOB|nr:uroporphyrinogen-III synthase [Yoonia tamlensis]SFR55058.1 uroporphyrinogen-III synthase [Yoonia tamlensis]